MRMFVILFNLNAIFLLSFELHVTPDLDITRNNCFIFFFILLYFWLQFHVPSSHHHNNIFNCNVIFLIIEIYCYKYNKKSITRNSSRLKKNVKNTKIFNSWWLSDNYPAIN